MFAVHPDTSSLKQITFHVTSHEGSVALSCETGLRLSLIQSCSNLDQIPDSASLICSNADYPMKRKSKKSVQVSKQSQIVFTRKKQVLTNLFYKRNILISMLYKKFKKKQACRECQANVMDDKECQSNVCSVKNCQETQNTYMQPMKPTKKKLYALS